MKDLKYIDRTSDYFEFKCGEPIKRVKVIMTDYRKRQLNQLLDFVMLTTPSYEDYCEIITPFGDTMQNYIHTVADECTEWYRDQDHKILEALIVQAL